MIGKDGWFELAGLYADIPFPLHLFSIHIFIDFSFMFVLHDLHVLVDHLQVFAMPETALGLFPDVGASYFLSRLPGFLGTDVVS